VNARSMEILVGAWAVALNARVELEDDDAAWHALYQVTEELGRLLIKGDAAERDMAEADALDTVLAPKAESMRRITNKTRMVGRSILAEERLKGRFEE
jgi:hypothetical protein